MEPCAAHVLPVAGCTAHTVAELALGCRECSWKGRHRSLLPLCWSDSGHQAWRQVPWPYIEPSWKLELHLLIPLPPLLKYRIAGVFLHLVSRVLGTEPVDLCLASRSPSPPTSSSLLPCITQSVFLLVKIIKLFFIFSLSFQIFL